MKRGHQCCRCHRHVPRTVETFNRSGRRKTFCEPCLETLRNKGQDTGAEASSALSFRDRLAATDGPRRSS